MSTSQDRPLPDDGRADLALDVRQALAGPATWAGSTGSETDVDMDVDGFWARGRARRSRKRAGAAAVAGLASVAAAAVVWSSGLLGGTEGPQETIATFPQDLTTFVFAPSGVAEPAPPTTSPVTVADPAELRGTSWVLQDALWGEPGQAADLVGAAPELTTLSFGAGAPDHPGWGFETDGCGGGWFQEDLTLTAEGAFDAGTMATEDRGCPEPAQRAEDFWINALQHGGTLHEAAGGWLLLSVNPTMPDGATTPTGPVDTTTVTGTTPAVEQPHSPEPSTPAPPGEPSEQAPPQQPSQEPSLGTPQAPATEADPGIPFVPAEQESTHGDWPGGGGDLLAPTVRAASHQGYDRIVVDLTGQDSLGWRAAYTPDPRLDGSGQPAEIAGDQVLQVWLSGMGYPPEGSEIYQEGVLFLDTHQLGSVVEVMRTTPFEGRLQVLVGMDGQPRPYRIFELESPRRLVIDVQQ